MVRRGLSAVLEHSQVAHYLLSLGLVNPRAVIEEDLTVTDVSRRNTVFLATSARGPSYVVKEPGPAGAATLAREAAILTGLARAPALAGLIPELVHYDEAAVRLVLRSPPGALDWGRQRRFSPLTARALGRALAAVQTVRLEVEPLAGDDERLWGLSLPEPSLARVRSLSAGALDLLSRVQADRDLCDRLSMLRDEVSDPVFIHGDLRWENCLAVPCARGRRRTRVLLIDWEHAGPGWPELDLAAALAEYLRTWVDSFPAVQPESDLSRLDAGARRPLAAMQAAMLALWLEHRRATSQRVGMLRVTELAAVRLLETAFEYAGGAPFVTGHVIVLMQVAANMLQAPGYAAWNVLGLRE
jgi:aminoglycoside phosphotransferase (APT) family kinase protein